jgi:hypothetical protein
MKPDIEWWANLGMKASRRRFRDTLLSDLRRSWPECFRYLWAALGSRIFWAALRDVMEARCHTR